MIQGMNEGVVQNIDKLALIQHPIFNFLFDLCKVLEDVIKEDWDQFLDEFEWLDLYSVIFEAC